MALLRLIAVFVLAWIIAGWAARKLRSFGAWGTQRRARDRERYRELTDQPIDDAEYEDLSKE